MKLGSVRETSATLTVKSAAPKESKPTEAVPVESFSVSTTDVKCELARPYFWQNVQIEGVKSPPSPPVLPVPEAGEESEDGDETVRPAGDDADGPGVGGGYSGFYTLAGPMTSDGLLWYTNDGPKQPPKALPAPQEPVKSDKQTQEAEAASRS